MEKDDNNDIAVIDLKQLQIQESKYLKNQPSRCINDQHLNKKQQFGLRKFCCRQFMTFSLWAFYEDYCRIFFRSYCFQLQGLPHEVKFLQPKLFDHLLQVRINRPSNSPWAFKWNFEPK